MAKKRTRKSEAPSPIQNADRNYRQLASILTKIVSIGLIVAAPLVPEGSPESFQNWPMLLLWLLVGVGVFADFLLHPKKRLQWSLVDACYYGVCLWAIASGIASLLLETGHARPTINAIWQWVGFAVGFFALRSLMETAQFRRAAILGALGIAIGCSCAGLYQKHSVFPAIRTDYQKLDEESKQNALRQGGISNVEVGSVERTMWENRLFSTETTSTFVLANSLAAFLTPCCILALGFFIHAIQSKSKSGLMIVFAAAISILLLYSLWITKSRSGLLAVGMGTIGLVSLNWKNSAGQFPWKWAVAGAVLLGVSASSIWLSGAIKTEAMKEASKSLLYRIEYWQASTEMIKDHWLLGCGPGNFQQYYSSYQLPQSSETVSDPHNFVVEIWSNAGTPAVIFLIAGCILWMVNSCRCCTGEPLREAVESERIQNMALNKKGPIDIDNGQPDDLNGTTFNAILVCGTVLGWAIGCFQAITSGMDYDLIFVAGAACLVFFGSLYFLNQSQFETCIFSSHSVSEPVALIAFTIGLCASGGISFPSVAILGIVLLAATLSHFNSYQWPTQRWFNIAGIAICVIGIFLFRFSVVDPIQSANRHQRVAEQAINKGQVELAFSEMEKAIAADPADGNFLFFKTQLLFRKFEQQPTPKNLATLIESTEKAVKARPHNSKVALESGKLFLSLSKRVATMEQKDGTNGEMLKRVNAAMIEQFHTAHDRRPNDAQHVAYLAYAFDVCEDPKNAKKWAEAALDLNAVNPHKDRDLGRFPFRYSNSNSDDSVEQELQRIRSK